MAFFFKAASSKGRSSSPVEIVRCTKESLVAVRDRNAAKIPIRPLERLFCREGDGTDNNKNLGSTTKSLHTLISPSPSPSPSPMSFFFKAAVSKGRPTSPVEIVKLIKESLLALDTKTVAKALEDVEKNISFLRQTLVGDRETEPNQELVMQIAIEICKEDVLSLFVHKLPSLGWEARKDLVNCWCVLLWQKVGLNCCCVQYLENHVELLDFLVVCYNNIEIALNCGNMLRECIKHESLAKYILESASFELFFKYAELPNFDIASDALCTFKDLLTKHEMVVSEFLGSHYEQFFELYAKLLTSTNYLTRRQSVKFLSEFLLEPPNSHIMKRYILEVRYLKPVMALLKDSSKNIKICAFHIFKVFVANPNKSQDIIAVLVENHEELLELIHNLPMTRGEDEQLEEEVELIVKEIERLSRGANVRR